MELCLRVGGTQTSLRVGGVQYTREGKAFGFGVMGGTRAGLADVWWMSFWRVRLLFPSLKGCGWLWALVVLAGS